MRGADGRFQPGEARDARLVVIPGGARGIGRALGRAFVERGARVVLGDIDRAVVLEAATELGRGTVGRWLDVTDAHDFARFLDAVESELGPIDVLVNHAGVVFLGPFELETEIETRTMIDVNLCGVVNGTRLALTRMRARDRGHIVNIASAADRAGFVLGATYAATQYAVIGFSESVRAELRGTGIELTCVVATSRDAEREPVPPLPGLEVPPEDVAQAVLAAVEGRAGRPSRAVESAPAVGPEAS